MISPGASPTYTISAPSNIALIKYWGKQDSHAQWPANDSLSMTLDKARTITSARVTKLPVHEVFFAGHQLFESDVFAKKIFSHLKFLAKDVGTTDKLRIETRNTFPASCGIASSASGFAALTTAALAAWHDAPSFADLSMHGFGLERLSYYARLGSGSACRSILGGFVHWVAGESASVQHVKSVFPSEHWALADIIVIVADKRKSVSSSTGHKAAITSPFFEPRIAGMPQKIRDITQAIKLRDIDALGKIIEAEALDMHTIAATSRPSTMYLSNESLEFIAWLRKSRDQGAHNGYFTIDAGPNIHVICEHNKASQIAQLIAERFPKYELLIDHIGHGPFFVAQEGLES